MLINYPFTHSLGTINNPQITLFTVINCGEMHDAGYLKDL